MGRYHDIGHGSNHCVGGLLWGNDQSTMPWWLPMTRCHKAPGHRQPSMSHYTALVTSSHKVVVDKKPYRHAWKASVDPNYKGMVDTSTQSATPHYMGCVSLPPVFWDEWSVLGIELCYNSENDIQQNQSASWCRCRCNKWSVANDLGLIPRSQVNIDWFRWWLGACSAYDFYRHK